MNEQKIVMRDSDEAAQIKTLTGWVSRNGHFWRDDERMARYDGCTHDRCECGEIMDKMYTSCEGCRHKKNVERYENLPLVDWDGETPLCMWDDDKYFFDENSVYDYCDEHEVKASDLMLVVCEPQFPREIHADDYFEDFLPEDSTLGDVAPELEVAFDKLNEAIRAYKKPLSWIAGKERVMLKDQVEEVQSER